MLGDPKALTLGGYRFCICFYVIVIGFRNCWFFVIGFRNCSFFVIGFRNCSFFAIGFRNCFDSVLFLVFHFSTDIILGIFSHRATYLSQFYQTLQCSYLMETKFVCFCN